MTLLYTQPIFSMGYSVLATEDNIGLFKRRMLSNDYPDTLKKQSIERIQQLEQHKDEWANLFPEDSLRQDKVYPFPARIGILMNEYSGSSTEFFLHRAAQSTRRPYSVSHRLEPWTLLIISLNPLCLVKYMDFTGPLVGTMH